MKYVALLRGINVGGNNIIKMIALKAAFEKDGYTDVVTYIQSGNVVFQSDMTNLKKLTEELQNMLTDSFNYPARVVIKSKEHMQHIVDAAPRAWKTRNDIRCYVAFLSNSISIDEAVKEIELNEKVDTLSTGPEVIYMTSLLKELTKSRFNKLPTKKIYMEMTIRNYNTTKKLLELMEKK